VVCGAILLVDWLHILWGPQCL